MKSFKVTFYKGLRGGLRKFKNAPANAETLTELYNLAPAEQGLEIHEIITDMNADGVSWGGGVQRIGDIFQDHDGDVWTDDDGDVFTDHTDLV